MHRSSALSWRFESTLCNIQLAINRTCLQMGDVQTEDLCNEGIDVHVFEGRQSYTRANVRPCRDKEGFHFGYSVGVVAMGASRNTCPWEVCADANEVG